MRCYDLSWAKVFLKIANLLEKKAPGAIYMLQNEFSTWWDKRKCDSRISEESKCSI